MSQKANSVVEAVMLNLKQAMDDLTVDDKEIVLERLGEEIEEMQADLDLEDDDTDEDDEDDDEDDEDYLGDDDDDYDDEE